jgi:hypothetical protein
VPAKFPSVCSGLSRIRRRAGELRQTHAQLRITNINAGMSYITDDTEKKLAHLKVRILP